MPQPLSALLQENPVVVTGLGVFGAAGRCCQDFYASLLRGLPTASRPPWADDSLAACVAPDPDLTAPALRPARRMDRSTQLALAAVQEAWTHAGLDSTRLSPERLGVFAGTSRGPLGILARSFDPAHARRPLPSLAPHGTLASLSGAIARLIQARGPALAVSASCTSSAQAIVLAAQQILLGGLEVAVAGGAEAPLLPAILRQMAAAGVLGSHRDPGLACRPFAAARNGTVLGEGAAFLVLESLASARQREAPILARLAGWDVRSDPGQRAGMEAQSSGVPESLRAALALARLHPAQIGYVHAHGTGTLINDRIEGRALQQVFPGGVPCSSTKPVTGHCLGAAAAFGAVAGILAMQHGQLPPSVNSSPRDPDCDLDLVGPTPRPSHPEAVLINASGFWGTQAALVFTASLP